MRRFLAMLGCLALAPSCAEMEVLENAICIEDAGCPVGQRCLHGYCVVDAPNQITIAARFKPPAGSGLVEQQLAGLPPTSEMAGEVTLLEAAVLVGNVREHGSPGATNVPGQITLTAPGEIPGLSYRFEATSLDGLAAKTDHGFQIAVLPGRTYDGTFWATSSDIPPAAFQVTPEDLAKGEITVAVHGWESSKWTSVLVKLEGDPTPIEKARVIPINEDGTSGNPVYTTAGYAEVKVAPECHRVRLLISAPEKGPLFPDFLTDYHAALSVQDKTRPPEPPLPPQIEAYIPKPSQDDMVSAQIVVTDPLGAPVPYLHVAIQGAFAAGGTLSRQLTTDASGVASFEALAGTYQCAVTTPAGDPLASWSGPPKELSVESPSWSIQLEPRSRLTGEVRDHLGRSVGAGTLFARRRAGDRAATDLAVADPVVTTTLGGDGSFEVYLDPGAYDLRVVPDPRTGQPPRFVDAVEVGKDTDLVIGLGEPGLVALVVLDPTGALLEGVDVEIVLLQGDAPARRLTQGTTNAWGGVALPVPFVPAEQ
jgi:hypothetical protein